jgi:hypothetical protein
MTYAQAQAIAMMMAVRERDKQVHIRRNPDTKEYYLVIVHPNGRVEERR